METGGASAADLSGRTLVPTTSTISNEIQENSVPVKVGATSITGEIKRNSISENNSISNTETGISTPDRNVKSGVEQNEIKSVIPPVRSVTPSTTPIRQNTQESRPRTSTSASQFEQQRSANALINSVNAQQSSNSMAEQMSKMPQPSNSGSSLEGNNVQRITSPNTSASKANFRLEVPEPKSIIRLHLNNLLKAGSSLRLKINLKNLL